jgi:phospholipase C
LIFREFSMPKLPRRLVAGLMAATLLHTLAPARAATPTDAAVLAQLRQHVRYVFILFQENRSFDSFFGSFPGAEGLYTHPPAATPGFTQPLRNTDGSLGTIQPFRIGPAQNAADLDDPGHTHPLLIAKMDIHDSVAAMDHFALAEEAAHTPPGGLPSLAAKQRGELTMAHVDCDTIPFLWHYADRFALFDHVFQHTISPSAPNAIAMLAGQTGETQWVKHPEQAAQGNGPGVPVLNNLDPSWTGAGSGMPVNPRDHGLAQINQTYASLPLSFMGGAIGAITATDRDGTGDLADLRQDIQAIAHSGRASLPWGWYQEGFDREPTDPPGTPAGGTHLSYVTHHNGAQYFGYIANNPQVAAHLHGLDDFFQDMAARRLPASGVFYVRGGYHAITDTPPADADATVRGRFRGDDDHPGYSDSALSEALIAREVNAIARSPYWAESAIIITYDEAGGFYDHVPPRILETGPDGTATSRGARIPFLLLSPYGRAHAVIHDPAEHNSVIRLIDLLFGLQPLAQLPDEAQARADGKRRFGQTDLGPDDAGVADVSDLLAGFDPARLAGTAPPLAAASAIIPDAEVAMMPPYHGAGCAAIGIRPVDVARGLANSPPADFNPRPVTNPTPPG